MGQVVIQFEGVCVNFRQSVFPRLPAKHRIVLINASPIGDIWGIEIAPHQAGFTVGDNPAVDRTPLNGAVVKISNPTINETQSGVTYDPSYADIPSLQSLTPNVGDASMAVLMGNNPDLVSCYFDVDYGTISSSFSIHDGIMTVVTIQTDGDPLYQLTPFATSLSSDPITETEPVLATNQMFFSNEEEGANIANASDNDFLLNYLVLSPPPLTQPNIPETAPGGSAINRKSELAKVLGIVALTEVGCSNSAYP